MTPILQPFLIFFIFTTYVLYVNGEEESYEYESSDEVNKQADAKANEGTRLVGARTSKVSAVPFIVGLDLQGYGYSTSCTGSLISTKWIVTAAHCTALIPDKQPGAIKKCVKNGKGKFGRQSFNCRKLKDGSLEYSNIRPEGIIWAGLTSMEEKNKAEMHKLNRIIRHKYTYFGGARYGTNGGYDISLLEIEGESKQPPACLPSPKFKDQVPSKLAGYGRFLRDQGRTCQTDEQGLMKYHYCEQEGSGEDICKKEPPPQSKDCQKFFKKNPQSGLESYKDEHTDKKMTAEISLVKNGKVKATCYHLTETNQKYGWCRTQGNYYNLQNPKEFSKGWGFCSKDCFLEKRRIEEGGSGVLRVVDKVDVLDEDLCNIYLEKSLSEGKPKTRPEVLCVGYIKKFKTKAIQMNGKPAKGPVRHFGDYFNKGFYITSAGTCNGDSGGPLYVQETPSKFIVTGAVSGGRGLLGRCGGINNPVHYARVKKFTTWIVSNMKNRDGLCWDVAFEKLLGAY